MSEPLRLLVIGAHPDDAEYKAGGLAAIYRKAGHAVRFVSVTDGGAGHHLVSGWELVDRRRAEAAEAGAALGIESEVWDHPDARLEPTLERREQVIRAVRSYRPDLVLTHRPNDYHPDSPCDQPARAGRRVPPDGPFRLPRRAAPEARPGDRLSLGRLHQAEPVRAGRGDRHRTRLGRQGGDAPRPRLAVLRVAPLQRPARRGTSLPPTTRRVGGGSPAGWPRSSTRSPTATASDCSPRTGSTARLTAPAEARLKAPSTAPCSTPRRGRDSFPSWRDRRRNRR